MKRQKKVKDSDSSDESDTNARPVKRANPFFKSSKNDKTSDDVTKTSDDVTKTSDDVIKDSDDVTKDSCSDDSAVSESGSSSDDFSDTDDDDDLDSDGSSDSSSDSDAEADAPEGNDEDEEDPLITALKKAKEKQERKAPPDIKFRSRNVTDISFHPANNLIAASLIDGEMSIFEYSNDSNKLSKKLNIHKSTIRSLEFDQSGRFLYSGSKDKTFKITDVETSQVVFKGSKAHESSLYKVKPLTVNLLATGDEDGTVKLWDNRQKSDSKWSSVMEVKKFDEFVTDIFFDEEVDDKIMVASSGEGTLLSFNLRGKRPDIQSEVYEGELNTMGIVHKNSKLVAGCGDGKLYMFDWKLFGYHSADFKGHPDAINHLVSATDNVIITACEDGSIRAVHLYPHRFIGTVGHHEESFPVEKLDISATGDLVASISHDQKIKFWSIKYLEEIEYNKKPKPFQQKKLKIRRKENRMRLAKEIEYQLPSSNRGNRKDFFKGLDDEK